MKKLFIPVLGLALFATSCRKENNITPTPSNLKIPYTTLSASSNYKTTFVDVEGKTTVDFSGQTTRINMLKEIDAHIKTGTSADIDAVKLINMFRNQNTPFASADLNAATDKVVSSKTAQSFPATEADAERARFISYFNELERISKMNGQTALQGKAGVLGGNRLVDEKGFELSQFVQKGLIGAMMLDQIANIYLGTEKQSADNTEVATGKNYTAMEHHWDEAYGYLTANETYPIKGSESFLGEYARQGASASGGADNLYLAFLKGRAAIVNNDLTTRDEQIAYIRTELEKAVAAVAISYLNKTNSAADDASRFHALSEGVGFIYSLRFAHNAKINKAKSEELLNILMGKTNGFWSLTPADINNVRDQVANTFGIDKTTVLSH
ncbi:MAG: DUF4856 domain-containing protein [Taibaiella sp.]|nr:DUF4856 domain-containing protein [Taibaiella sp.]